MPRKAEYDRIKLRMAEDSAFEKAWKEARSAEQKQRYAEGKIKRGPASPYNPETYDPKPGRLRRLLKLGWTQEHYDEAKHEQGNCCAICGETFKETPSADHAHVEPPVPRGLLCHLCNRALGMFKDSPELLEKAAAYLRKWAER
jgi:hypothetical protein